MNVCVLAHVCHCWAHLTDIYLHLLLGYVKHLISDVCTLGSWIMQGLFKYFMDFINYNFILRPTAFVILEAL